MTAAEIYLGTYAKDSEEGIVRYRLADHGALEKTGVWNGINRPSWLLMSERKNMLYAVQELAPCGAIVAYSISDGQLKKEAQLSTEGANPCHLSMDDKQEFLFAANYSSGSLAVYRLNEKGVPLCLSHLVRHHGHGPNELRQDGPHVHFSKFYRDELYVVDLGVDTIFRYSLDRDQGILFDTGRNIKFPDGAGPRHLIFSPVHPGIMYVIAELSSSVFTVDISTQNGKILDSQSMLPEDFHGATKAAAIKLNDDSSLLFASSRGHDSIAVYEVLENGLLCLRGIYGCGGKSPRDIEAIGKDLFIANQDSDRLTVMNIDTSSADFGRTRVVAELTKPVCICR